MKDETLYRWNKRVDSDELQRWEDELVFSGIPHAVEKSVGRKTWQLLAYFPGRREAEDLKARFGGGVTRVRPEDWQPQSEASDTVIRIRDRFVVTEHLDPEKIEALAAEHPDRTVLSFPAQMAFGTGGHPTTASCLRMLVDTVAAGESENSRPWSMLDLGCGSGILAVAAEKLGAGPVAAVELDGKALDVARENAVRNAAPGIEFIEADAAKWLADARRAKRRFDLVAANLFSELLIALFPKIAAVTAPGGTVIVSGFLTSQTRDVSEAARRAGVPLARFIRRGKWVAGLGGKNAG